MPKKTGKCQSSPGQNKGGRKMKTIGKCAVCGDPIYDFQKVLHEGCAGVGNLDIREGESHSRIPLLAGRASKLIRDCESEKVKQLIIDNQKNGLSPE